MDEGLAPARNLDKRVSNAMKIVQGQRTRRVGVEEETDAGEREKNVTTSVPPTSEEENSDPRPLETRYEKQDGEGDNEEQQVRHVPGGAWLQQGSTSRCQESPLHLEKPEFTYDSKQNLGVHEYRYNIFSVRIPT
ncbi:hypothetical protein NDU88_001821 [Pleurodeles waltl]|uniref:Uncharacterized protein n=1 Tax=Pleurodeles waltl TaxID=8319 RepID=A0AAV7KZL2_PLEWA|nr:hypothetical protein NDU88_001821 [Pleurodeles waltl]